jgi:hypothetical protein
MGYLDTMESSIWLCSAGFAMYYGDGNLTLPRILILEARS